MYKEIIISVCIIVMVIVADLFTQNYTKKSVNKLSSELDILKNYLVEENDYKLENRLKK